MSKAELQECLFSLKIAHDYLKTYGLQDYDREHVLMHLKLALELVEKDPANAEKEPDNF